MSIDRYSIGRDQLTSTLDLFSSFDGEYVLYEDHLALVTELKATISELYEEIEWTENYYNP